MHLLLTDCRQIEEVAGRIYQHLASVPGFAAEVRATFQQLAADEREHSRQLDLALQVPELEKLGVNRIAWVKVDEALQLAQRFLTEVEQQQVSEEKALRLAVDLEKYFIKIHLDNAVHFSNQQLADLFNGLGRSDQQHLNTLRECLTWWHRRNKSAGGTPAV
ncbi:hypothetical protein JCM30471_26440 [Desulfuromonas carbonis]|uniref:ferritin family protein n=1 Tax=Desulfuromonas sp. DDH964 TaxID=1823759 RepID=UPI00078DF8BE|nr:ferritin family protein [Desulfuromonas sp. DDH964]AMV70836.1 hypothetical protein DBW_0435 [Desulfuromonas sp. DDH964]